MNAKFKKFDAEYAISQMEKIISDYKEKCNAYLKPIGTAAKPFEFIKSLEDLSQFYYAAYERLRFLGELYCDINGHGYVLYSPIGDVYYEKLELLLAFSSDFSADVLNLSRQFNHTNLPASSTSTEQQEQEPLIQLPLWYKAHIKPAENLTLLMHTSCRDQPYWFGYYELDNYYLADGTQAQDVVDWSYFPSSSLIQSDS
jgi:hypothetical protein